jgi:glycosyltransferase involved in cell wall biosynthesis
LRVCFLSHCYPSYPGHSAGCFVESLAQGLGRFGCEVSVVTPRIFVKDALFEARGSVKVYRHRFLTANRYLHSYGRVPIFRMLTYMTGAVWTGLRVIKKDSCSLIHAHWVVPSGLIALILARLTGLPFIVHARGSEVSVYLRQSWFLRYLGKLVLRRAHSIVARGANLKREVVEMFHLEEGRIHVVRDGVDLNLFRPLDKRAARAKLGLPEDRDIVLFVGHLYPIKGVQHLIEALPAAVRANRDVLCILVGEGGMREPLARRVRELKLENHVSLVGEQPHERIPLWMNAADMLVVPSLSEAGPDVAVEALACHTPVVGTRVGDMPNLIAPDENGLLVEPGDAEAIASSIKLLLANGSRGLHQRMKDKFAAQPPVESVEAEAQQHLGIYHEVLRGV